MPQVAPPLSDNAALNELVESVGNIEALVSGSYDSIDGNNALEVGDSDSPATEAADNSIVKRVVTNLGDNQILVFEGGIIVATLGKFQTWVSDLSGSKSIKLQCVTTGQTSVAALANYKRTL